MPFIINETHTQFNTQNLHSVQEHLASTEYKES